LSNVLTKLFLSLVLFACVLSLGCVEQAGQQPSPGASVAPSVVASPVVSVSVNVSPAASPTPRVYPSPSPGAWDDFAQKEVVVDFLYADWCPHCQKMEPIVQEAERAFPKERFKARWWNEANRTNDKGDMYIFDYYRRKGFFGGFPSFVILGGYKRVGEMPRNDFFDWVCSFFHDPRPAACGEYAKKTW
jgi:thiol-disulfide isomerase/thioredoxin